MNERTPGSSSPESDHEQHDSLHEAYEEENRLYAALDVAMKEQSRISDEMIKLNPDSDEAVSMFDVYVKAGEKIRRLYQELEKAQERTKSEFQKRTKEGGKE